MPVKKTVKKEVKKTVKSVKKVAANPTKDSVQSSLKISVLDTQGKAAGSVNLPDGIFSVKINPVLMAQAVRVYLANQRQGNASVKTRGEVTMTTAKWYRQKGTGRARHGAKSAPIFVKGGVAHGPKLRDYSLSLPPKMKHSALFSALSVKHKDNNILVVSGFEKMTKTKNMALALRNVDRDSEGKKRLIVMPKLIETIYRSGRNIAGVRLTSAKDISTYEVLDAKKVIFMKEALDVLKQQFIK